MEVGAPQLPTAKPSRGTLARGAGPPGFAYGAITLYGGAFQPTSATRCRPAGDRIPSREPSNTTSPPARRRRVWFGLSPFRSPLLRGSRLISFPPPTKMFPFGGFPSRAWVTRPQMPRVYPWREFPFGYPGFDGCLRLPRAFRRLPRPSSAPEPSHPPRGVLPQAPRGSQPGICCGLPTLIGAPSEELLTDQPSRRAS